MCVCVTLWPSYQARKICCTLWAAHFTYLKSQSYKEKSTEEKTIIDLKRNHEKTQVMIKWKEMVVFFRLIV